MNDRELERLVRMAVEAETFEEPCPVVRSAGASSRRLPRFLVTGLGSVAAACVLVGLLLALRPPPPQPLTMGDLRPGASEPTTQPVIQPVAEKSLVMGIFRDRDGNCTCVQWREHKWGGRRLSDVGRGELVDAVLKASCSTDPRQVMVVAIAGPEGVLPDSREGADRLARVIADAADGWQELPSAAYAALGDRAAQATVVTEKVSMRAGGPDYLSALSLPRPPGMR